MSVNTVHCTFLHIQVCFERRLRVCELKIHCPIYTSIGWIYTAAETDLTLGHLPFSVRLHAHFMSACVFW